MTKLTSNKSYEKLGNPGSAPSTEIGRRAPIAKVLNGNGEGWRCGRRRLTIAYLFNVERKIVGSKSKSHHFRCKREFISAGQDVAFARATKDRLSLLGKAQVRSTCSRCDLSLFRHDSNLPCTHFDQFRETPATDTSNGQAIYSFSFHFYGLPEWNETGHHRTVIRPDIECCCIHCEGIEIANGRIAIEHSRRCAA